MRRGRTTTVNAQGAGFAVRGSDDGPEIASGKVATSDVPAIKIFNADRTNTSI